MSFTDEDKIKESSKAEESGKNRRVILTQADQIPDSEVEEIMNGNKRITEVNFNDSVSETSNKKRRRKNADNGSWPEKTSRSGNHSKKTSQSNIDTETSGINKTENRVAASIRETENALRDKIFANEKEEVSKTQRIRAVAVESITVADLDDGDSEELETGLDYGNKKGEDASIAATTRYNSEMIIEELERATRKEETQAASGFEPENNIEDNYYLAPQEEQPNPLRNTSAMRRVADRERRLSPKGGYRPITTAPFVFGFGADEIPDAPSQLTRRAKLNETRKVTSRAKKIEKAKESGSIEPDCEEILTFEFEGMSNAHVPLDNDSVFQIEGVNGYPGIREQRRPPVTRGRRRKYGNQKKLRKRQGPVFVIVSVLLLALIVFICIFGHDFAEKVFDDRAMNSRDLSKIEYTVDLNTTDEEVAEFLVENGMVESVLYYKIRAIIFEADYEPGTYEISPSYSTEKIINILSGYDYSAGD